MVVATRTGSKFDMDWQVVETQWTSGDEYRKSQIELSVDEDKETSKEVARLAAEYDRLAKEHESFIDRL